MLKLEYLPEGWKYYPKDSNEAPEGYRLATNGEKRWSGYFEKAWVPDYRQRAYWKAKQVSKGTDEGKIAERYFV